MKKCDICGSTLGKIRNSVKFGKVLCSRHYNQFRFYGKELPITMFDPNEVIKHEGYAELILRNVKHDETARTKISPQDLDEVMEHKWRLRGDGYVDATINRKCVLLHRFILKTIDGIEIDHINRDRTDNRRENLRESTRFENTANRGTVSRNALSGRIGVSYHSRRRKWVAAMRRNGVVVLNKGFDTIQEAIKARELAEQEYKFR